MKSPFVRDLKPDEIAIAVFLVTSKEVRQKRTGEIYLSLVLSDRTGELECKMWDNVPEVVETFERDDFVKVKGFVQLYNNRLQLTIHKMRRMQDHEIDPRDFFPVSRQDPDVMWAELRDIVAEVQNVHIRHLLDAFLDDSDIAARYRVAPAAKSIHHAFRGGLLEHVVSLLKLSKVVGAHYRALNADSVDQDLLTAGIVLHDIGKIYELRYDRSFAYSTEGQLIGHIALAIRMISEKLRTLPEFPDTLRNLIEHMVLSHHGQLEFGSPKVPVFPEALLLHYLDDMDSKMECMRAQIEKDPQTEGVFSGWNSALGRVSLRKSRYLEPGQPSACQPQLMAERTEITKPEVLNNDTEVPGNEPERLITKPVVPVYCVTPLPSAPVSSFNKEVRTSALNSNTNAPGRSHAPAPPTYKPAPAANSLFAAKLQQALNDERK